MDQDLPAGRVRLGPHPAIVALPATVTVGILVGGAITPAALSAVGRVLPEGAGGMFLAVLCAVLVGMVIVFLLVVAFYPTLAIDFGERTVTVWYRIVSFDDITHVYAGRAGANLENVLVRVGIPRGRDARIAIESKGIPALSTAELAHLIGFAEQVAIAPDTRVMQHPPVGDELGPRDEDQRRQDFIAWMLLRSHEASFDKRTLLAMLKAMWLARPDRGEVAVWERNTVVDRVAEATSELATAARELGTRRPAVVEGVVSAYPGTTMLSTALPLASMPEQHSRRYGKGAWGMLGGTYRGHRRQVAEWARESGVPVAVPTTAKVARAVGWTAIAIGGLGVVLLPAWSALLGTISALSGGDGSAVPATIGIALGSILVVVGGWLAQWWGTIQHGEAVKDAALTATRDTPAPPRVVDFFRPRYQTVVFQAHVRVLAVVGITLIFPFALGFYFAGVGLMAGYDSAGFLALGVTLFVVMIGLLALWVRYFNRLTYWAAAAEYDFRAISGAY